MAKTAASPAASSTDTGPSRSSLHVLAQRNFGPFFVGSLLSNCGTWFQNIAQSLLIYRLTGSSFLVGVTSFAQFAGVILLVPWSGDAADRFDRRKLIIATQLGAMAVTGTLAALSVLRLDSVPVVIGLALILGLTTAYGTPALQAIVPSLVRREEIGAAITMNSVTFNLARAVGPVLGALVVRRLGISWAFGLNCLSYAALIGALLIVQVAPQEKRAGRRPKLRDSFDIVQQDMRLAALLGVVSSVSFAIDPVSTLAPAFATTVFHRADAASGYLIGALGTGAVIAALVAAGKSATPYRRIAIMLAVLGAGITVYAWTPTLAVGLVALVVAGFGYLAGQTRATTLLQTSVPDNQRGRIMALWSVCFLGTRPLASLLDGALASVLGVRVAAAILALPAFAAAAMMGVLYTRHASGRNTERNAEDGATAASHD